MSSKSSFPVPSSLQDLERCPYNLLPYPIGFEDDDEASRAESFDKLVLLLERGNRTLISGGNALFKESNEEENCSKWNDEERIQALYTLVRKSSSLAPNTKKRLVSVVCQAVKGMSSILVSSGTLLDNGLDIQNISHNTHVQAFSQDFRDAFTCHLYMLYSVMFFVESESKVGKSIGNLVAPKSKSKKKSDIKKEKERKAETEKTAASREECALTMLLAAQTMGKYKSKLWVRGVPDEDMAGLPCRIAYQMLEGATGVVARKTSFADASMGIITTTINHFHCLIGTVVAALLDLLHSYEHIAALVAELCCMNSEESTNNFAIELLKEIGHLETEHSAGVEAGVMKASGVKNIAPFLNELAERKPSLVLENINLVLHHLDSEPYYLRSAIITTIGHVIHRRNEKEENEQICSDEEQWGEEKKKSQKLLKIKESLFDILTERVHDSSSYTRATVLKTWATLGKSQSIPLQRIISVTSLAIDRLQDKTVVVRKSAMQLLGILLENNPFDRSLCPEPYAKKVIEIKSYILENLPENLKDARNSAIKELGVDNNIDLKAKESIDNASLQTVIIEYADLIDPEEREADFCAKLIALQFVSSALEFIELFEFAHTSFESMLLSSNASDVTEALRFFVLARHFQLPCAVTGIKQALTLMWSEETSIKDEVLNAFAEVFVVLPGTERKELLPAEKIADNLLHLVSKATVSELTSIEEAMYHLVEDEVIPTEVFLILWSIASKSPGQPRSAAMLILSMGASANPSIVDSASRLRHLLEVGLGEYTENYGDWMTARSAAVALQRIRVTTPDPNSAKYIVLELIMERLCAVAQGDWCDDSHVEDTQAWFGAAEQAIDAIFFISPIPEKVGKEIICAIERTTFGFGHGMPQSSCHSLRLSRFFFVISHIALKLLVYTEALSGAVRHGNAARTLAKQEKADKAKSSENDSTENNSDDDDAIESELGVAQEEEAETENKVAEISEKEILGRGLINLFTPMLLKIVQNEGGKFSSDTLMQAATLALCKFMCISRSFCEQNLPLLFTALANAPTEDVTLRANTVIALGDLAFRFPNEVEPYTPRLYACLRDKSTRVRRHTLMVLTHLILNDMVKVKGQVCEIALCLKDDEIRIRDMARLLFNELSKRSNNPIYNLLPDIVSRLSEMSIKKEDFRCIMGFLLNFIKKEKQNETLVEKFVQRFPKCTTISQKADITFCLAQLKISEKCIKTLNENFKLYKDALFDEDIFKSFSSIVVKTKKNTSKQEMKDILEEWEKKLNEHSETSMEDQVASNQAERSKRRVARRVAKAKSRKSNVTPHVKEKSAKENCHMEHCDDGIQDKDRYHNIYDKENQCP